MNLRTASFALAVLVVLLLTPACRKSSAPPPPLAIEQVPAALSKAFKKTNPEVKELVNQIISAVQAQDYSRAYLGFQNLAVKPGLDKEQQDVTARGVMTLNTVLQSAQSSGDSKAAETLKTYRVNK